MRCIIWDVKLDPYLNFKEELASVCEVSFASNMEELQEGLGQEDVKTVFIQLELGIKAWQGIQSNMKLQMPEVRWVLFSSDEDSESLTEHQNSDLPADGYLIGPLTSEMIEDYFEDIVVLEQTLNNIDSSGLGSENGEIDLDFDSDTDLKVDMSEDSSGNNIQDKFDSVLGDDDSSPQQIGELTGEMINLAGNVEIDDTTDGKGFDIDCTNIFENKDGEEKPKAQSDELDLEFSDNKPGADLEIDTHEEDGQSGQESADARADLDLGFSSDQTSIAKVGLGVTATDKDTPRGNPLLNELDEEKGGAAFSLDAESSEDSLGNGTSSIDDFVLTEDSFSEGTMTETNLGDTSKSNPILEKLKIETENENQELSMIYGANTTDEVESQSMTSINVIKEESAIWKTDNSNELSATLAELKNDRGSLLAEISALKEENATLRRNELTLRTHIEDSKVEIELMKNRMISQNQDLKFQLQLVEDKKSLLEQKAKDYRDQYQALSEKIQRGNNRIKERESELESQLDLLKADSKAQIENRENKIIDLKRKIDNLEFNIENISMKEERSKQDKIEAEQRMNKVVSSLRFSLDVLESDSDDAEKLRVLSKLKNIG